MAAAKVALDVRKQPGVAAARSQVGDGGRVTVHVRLRTADGEDPAPPAAEAAPLLASYEAELWTRGPHYPGPPGLEGARIRGTTDGIRVSVESPPVR